MPTGHSLNRSSELLGEAGRAAWKRWLDGNKAALEPDSKHPRFLVALAAFTSGWAMRDEAKGK